VSTSESRRSAARVGALSRAAKYPPEDLTRAARRGFLEKFRAEALAADPTLAGDDAELNRRAALLLRAHMVRLNRASVRSRSRRRSA
jgi:hypothetical protein